MTKRHKPVTLLATILAFGFLMRILFAFYYSGGWRPDEIFQNLEPAHWYLTGHGVITWEWQAKIRNWIMPGVAIVIWKATSLMGLGLPPSAVRVFFSVLSVSIIAAFSVLGKLRYGRTGLMICGITAIFWPDLLIGAARTGGEFQAGNTFALAICLALIGKFQQENAKKYYALYIFSAFFIGVTFDLRFQLVPACGLAILWIGYWIKNWTYRFCFLISFLIPVFFLGILDKITLGGYFISVYNNFYLNAYKGVADSYGVEHVYYYISFFIKDWKISTPIVFYFFFRGFRQYALPATLAVFIIFFHSAINHKEVSFIYAALPLIILVSSLSFSSMIENCSKETLFKYGLAVFVFCQLNRTYVVDQMRKSSSITDLMVKVSGYNDMCGLALMTDYYTWGASGGYTLVRKKDVPLYFYPFEFNIDGENKHYNYVISYRDYDPHNLSKKNITCADQYCLFKISDNCLGKPDYKQFENMVGFVEQPDIKKKYNEIWKIW
ncbi:hypothetical protein [Komagataeibacter xylinus]|uniref:hypothetical protein n=1 Tax=Komagataeibacter xylinus TaxID=28448 RepID=UPI00102FAE55|nr:hypothetical protein [Komagataeibacter xylinus]